MLKVMKWEMQCRETMLIGKKMVNATETKCNEKEGNDKWTINAQCNEEEKIYMQWKRKAMLEKKSRQKDKWVVQCSYLHVRINYNLYNKYIVEGMKLAMK